MLNCEGRMTPFLSGFTMCRSTNCSTGSDSAARKSSCPLNPKLCPAHGLQPDQRHRDGKIK